MDSYKDKIIVANNESDFIQNSEYDFSATYIILCERNSQEDEQILKNTICGLSLAEWVAMACENKPIFLNVSASDNILDVVRPYAGEKEFIVVLYANTPLLTKTHLKDLLSFAARKRFNVCKLKKGYILRSDFAMDAEAIYSNFSYDLVTNDFFEVDSLMDIDLVRLNLEKRMLNHYIKNGVFFDNTSTINIDASTKIGCGSRIFGGVSISDNSNIGENSVISSNSVIINSKIGNNCKISSGVIIENSIVKDNSEICSGANIIHSVVNESVKVGNSAKIIDSAINSESVIGNFANIDSASIGKGSDIGKFSNISGVGVTVVVDENSIIRPFSNVIKADK